MRVPKLESARLTLREYKRDDLGRAFLLWSHPTVVQFIGGKPNDLQQCWSRLLRFRGMWDLTGFGYWAVIEKSSGLYIGDVGFADFMRGVAPTFDGVPELGWALMPSHHGKGFATEAVRIALEWADQNFTSITGRNRSVCMIDPTNIPSLRVAAKCGYAEYARVIVADAPTILFEREMTGTM